MFDEDFNDTAGRYELSSIPAIQEAALIMYGRFIAHMYKREPDDAVAAMAKQHLSLQETENIVLEHASVDGELYAIGGDTAAEAKERISALMFALMDRVMSNVLAAGVKQDLLDCNYDETTNDFAFSITDKGKQIVENLRKTRDPTDRPDIPRD